jgi:LuxR family maltose regulon positive regulatory protein
VLAQAVEHGSRLGLVRTFVDEGKRLGDLLVRLAREGRLDASAAQHLDGLLARFGNAGQSPPAKDETVGASRPPGDAVNMTPRELEILRLISQAMSNKRIALTLNITLETVKWNVKNILAKLGVSSRYDAMTWARKKGLIE